MLILVTGATGKVGRRFIDILLQDPEWKNAKVRALCHNRTLPESDRLEVAKGSIADRAVCDYAMRDVTHVVHLATCKETPEDVMDVAIGGLVIYVACFAFGLGPIFWLLISEIYPLKNRGVAMSAVTVTNWAMNLVVAVTFLTLVSMLGHAGTFWLYGLVAIGAWIFFYRLVPETKGKSLEQIEAHWRSGKSPRQL